MSDKMEIDLSKAVDEVTEEVALEKKSEAKRKIRWVSDQIARFANEERSLEKALLKNRERLAKAQNKLDELRKGNWTVLSQINPQEPEKEND